MSGGRYTSSKVRFIVAFAVAVLGLSVAQAEGQSGKLYQGYYYWDAIYKSGQFALQGVRPEGATSNLPEIPETTVQYNTSAAKYSWDFCGAPIYIAFSLEETTYEEGSTANLADNTADLEVLNFGGERERSVAVLGGVRFRLGRAADGYIEAGERFYEDDQPDFQQVFRADSDDNRRSIAAMGIRARVGPTGNFALETGVRDDSLLGMTFHVGIMYHSAAAVSIGFSYELGGETKDFDIRRTVGTIQKASTLFTHEESATLTVRINL